MGLSFQRILKNLVGGKFLYIINIFFVLVINVDAHIIAYNLINIINEGTFHCDCKECLDDIVFEPVGPCSGPSLYSLY